VKSPSKAGDETINPATRGATILFLGMFLFHIKN